MIATAFQNMPDTAKVWVYQSNRPFTPAEIAELERILKNFVAQWRAHGQELAANFSIEYNQFIVMAVDESFYGASGCSIDASVHLIRAIETQFGVSLLDRTQVAKLSGDKLELFPFNQAKSKIQSGEVVPSSIIFDNSIQSLGAFRQKWRVPASESWMHRFFQ